MRRGCFFFDDLSRKENKAWVIAPEPTIHKSQRAMDKSNICIVHYK